MRQIEQIAGRDKRGCVSSFREQKKEKHVSHPRIRQCIDVPRIETHFSSKLLNCLACNLLQTVKRKKSGRGRRGRPVGTKTEDTTIIGITIVLSWPCRIDNSLPRTLFLVERFQLSTRRRFRMLCKRFVREDTNICTSPVSVLQRNHRSACDRRGNNDNKSER